VLDIAGTAFWLYVFARVFVGDVDRWMLSAISPELASLLDYRFLAYLVVLVLAAMQLRRWWRVGYVFFFPLVILFWKTPYFFYRRKSWPLLLAAVQTIASISNDLRYRLATGSLALLAAILIQVSSVGPILFASALYLFTLLTWTFIRLFRRVVRAPSFTTIQGNWIRRVLDSGGVTPLILLKDEYKRPDIERYSDAEAQQLAMNISFGIIINRALYLWAYQLERYRAKYAPALIFNTISYAGLFVVTILGLGAADFGLFKALPDQYSVVEPVTQLTFLVYASSNLAFSQGAGVVPVGQAALALQLLSGVIGVLVLVSLGLNVLLSYIRERDDASMLNLVKELKTRARDQEELFQQEYHVDMDEARRKLEEIGAGIPSVVTYITRSIPADFLTPDADGR